MWAWAQRHIKSEGEGPINLGVFDGDPLFSVTIDRVDGAYTLEHLNGRFSNRTPVIDSEICVAENWFKGRDLALAFRGKQEMQLLLRFLRLLAERAGRGEAPFHQRLRVALRLSDMHAVADLSNYADTPESLTAFLRRARERWTEVRPSQRPQQT